MYFLLIFFNVIDYFTNFFLEITCGGADVLRIIKFVWKLLEIVFFIIPMGLVFIITFDFVKNVVSGKEDEMRKNVNIVIKRIIFCISLFLVEPIVHFTVNLSEENDIDFAKCINIAVEGDLSQYEIKFEGEDYSDVESPDFTYDDGLILSGGNSNSGNSNNDSSISSNIGKKGDGLWVAHQKNSAEAVDNAIKEGFWGIEVDVHQDVNIFKLYHDSETEPYAGYDLDVFLDTCRKKNITAVLDLKYISNYDKLISLVKDKKMEENTIYQTSVGGAKKIHKKDNNARIWVLISDDLLDISENKKNELSAVKDSIEGINMRADHVDKNDIKTIHDLGLTICSFSYTRKLYKNADAETLREWGTNYIMANGIAE